MLTWHMNNIHDIYTEIDDFMFILDARTAALDDAHKRLKLKYPGNFLITYFPVVSHVFIYW